MFEDRTILAWTDATTTPEAGQTTLIRLWKIDGVTLLAEHAGLIGTSFDIPVASFGAEQIAIVEFKASRTDAYGTFESLQGHRLYVRVAAAASSGAFAGVGTATFVSGVVRAAALSASGSASESAAGSTGTTAGTLLVGNSTNGLIAAGQASANVQVGTAFQAVASGTATTVKVICGANSTANYRMCVYGATSDAAWGGSLLGRTADQSGMADGIDAIKSIPLIAPINIVAGNWYALTIHADGGVFFRSPNTAATERYFADTFADGPLSSAPASPALSSSAEPAIWLTT
ncbi:hypothetical protein [Sphingomonas sp.]|uniref:hypothetical protein n=1 Tax=Sphingomonas sp. TaxID=28214 RepID=UPI0025E87982|nr:hypothetical protein [Sphingomonas sp.]MBV9528330.1 hypothetical protein [Sphingomonas sp.]